MFRRIIVSIVQRIGRELPELKMGVRFPLEALNKEARKDISQSLSSLINNKQYEQRKIRV